MKLNPLLILLILAIQSCAVFNSDFNEYSTLKKSNLELINGTYEINSIKYQGQSNSSERQNFLKEIDRKIVKDTLIFDTTKVNSVELKILENEDLEVRYLEGDKIKRRRVIKAKLKKDGYLYLKNKNIGFGWIPYLFGSLDIKRTRITIDRNQNLVLEVSHFHGAALLLIIFLNYDTDRYKKTYKRIN